MPIEAEVHSLQAEIRRDEYLVTGRNAKHSAIIPNTEGDCRMPPCTATNRLNQRLFTQKQWPPI